MSQADESGSSKDGPLLQTDTEGLRGLPRTHESSPPIEAAWLLTTNPSVHEMQRRLN